MQQGYFVTGTDTNVGKTWASIALIRTFIAQGKKVVGMKPVASGCHWQDGELKNADAILMQQHSNVQVDYQLINPFAYEQAVSPHIAGKQCPANVQIIQQCFQQLAATAEVVIVEGAGGWYSPLAENLDNAALAQNLALPVILVVAIRLGCINQARLTLAAIQQAGVSCYGWIAVCVDAEMLYAHENIDYLQRELSAPLLGVMPYLEAPNFELLCSLFVLTPLSNG